MRTIITNAAYRSNEGGYSIIHVEFNDDIENSYADVHEVRELIDSVCTQTDMKTSPIGGFVYEGEYERIKYETETSVDDLIDMLKDHKVANVHKSGLSKEFNLRKLNELDYDTFCIYKENEYDYTIKPRVGHGRGYAVQALINKLNSFKGNPIVNINLDNWNIGQDVVTVEV